MNPVRIMTHTPHLDFGYPWWLSYGHLALLAPVATLLLWGYFRKWPKWPMVLLGALTTWCLAAFVVVYFVLDLNGAGRLPTESFLRSGVGKVLDLGAGTGRSSIMVLQARPQATVVALDLFGESFDVHFGPGESPQQRLLGNLKAVGLDQRVMIETADMRKLPFAPASFEAIVSCYAIDHLRREGIGETLAESMRVLQPGGDFLLMIVGKDPWVQFAFGPLLMHSATRGPAYWTSRVKEAGFEVKEEGMRPATFFVLARRP